MKTRPELIDDYLASEARYKELVQRTVSSELQRPNQGGHPSDLAQLDQQRKSALQESSSILRQLHVKSIQPDGSLLLKEIQCAEREIEGIEAHISTCDDFRTRPSEYSAMRSEQERQRQRILQCRAQLQNIGELSD